MVTSDHVWTSHAARALSSQVNKRSLYEESELRGTPNGIRTRATAVKGRRPRPLDDGGSVGAEMTLRPKGRIAQKGNGALSRERAIRVPSEQLLNFTA